MRGENLVLSKFPRLPLYLILLLLGLWNQSIHAQVSNLPKVITQEQFDRLNQGQSIGPASVQAAAAKEKSQEITSPSDINPLTQIIDNGNSTRKNGKYYGLVYQSDYASWGIRPENFEGYVHLEEAWDQFEKGSEVKVAVVDTGIDPEHPFLKPNVISLDGAVSPANFGKDFTQIKPANAPFDGHGHGTHVSGIIKSIFPEVKILALKYFNPQASNNQNLDASIKALEYAVANNVDIINYSGGGPEPSAEELKILKEAESKGIIVVAAAGNEQNDIDKKDKSYYPASYGLTNIISVTAHDESVRVLSTANYGKTSVDISAPGFKVSSSLPGGRSGKMTGTSQATAFVTGVVALIKSQYPTLSAREIKEIISKSGQKKSSLSDKCISGSKLHAGRALQLAKMVAQRKEGPRNVAGQPKAP